MAPLGFEARDLVGHDFSALPRGARRLRAGGGLCWTVRVRPATMRPMNRGRCLPLWLAMAATGCTDLDHFSTGQADSYCGSITVGGSFRAGFSPRVQMRLK